MGFYSILLRIILTRWYHWAHAPEILRGMSPPFPQLEKFTWLIRKFSLGILCFWITKNRNENHISMIISVFCLISPQIENVIFDVDKLILQVWIGGIDCLKLNGSFFWKDFFYNFFKYFTLKVEEKLAVKACWSFLNLKLEFWSYQKI